VTQPLTFFNTSILRAQFLLSYEEVPRLNSLWLWRNWYQGLHTLWPLHWIPAPSFFSMKAWKHLTKWAINMIHNDIVSPRRTSTIWLSLRSLWNELSSMLYLHTPSHEFESQKVEMWTLRVTDLNSLLSSNQISTLTREQTPQPVQEIIALGVN